MKLARTWPSGGPNDAPLQPEAPPSVPVDFGAMRFEEIQSRAQGLEDAVRAAHRERAEAGVAVAKARASLAEAAGRGLAAAQAVERAISEAGERLRAAGAVAEAVEEALRPFAAELDRLSTIRSAARFGAALAEKSRERDGIDAELGAALDQLASVTSRREAATAELLEIKRGAERAGHSELPLVTASYPDAIVGRTIRSLGRHLSQALVT